MEPLRASIYAAQRFRESITLERITTEYGTQLWMNRSIQVEGSFARNWNRRD